MNRHALTGASFAVGLILLSVYSFDSLAISPEIGPPPHLDVEQQRQFLRDAPIHVQARILRGAVSNADAWHEYEVEAVVLRTFKGADTLFVGKHFLVNLPRIGPSQPIAEMPKLQTYADISGLRKGLIFEAFLRHFGPPAGFTLAGVDTMDAPEERFKILSKPTYSPQLIIPPHSAHSPERAQRPYRQEPDLASAKPPVFPTKDAVLIFETLKRPGETFRAYYQARTWRTRVEKVVPSGENSEYRLSDAFGHYSLIVRKREHQFQPSLGGHFMGLIPTITIETPLPDGTTSTVAGLTCRNYDLTWVPGPGAFDRICLTQDGLDLRKNMQLEGTTEVKQVILGALPDNLFEVPPDYQGSTTFSMQ